MHDKRLVNRLQNYWNLIRRGNPMPEITQLNIASIDDLWPQCMRVRIVKVQGGMSFHYRYMGEKLIQMFGNDLTNMLVDQRVKTYPYGVIVKMLDEVMISKTFVLDQSQIINGNTIVKYRACLMPFGNEEKGITDIVIGFSDRAY